MEEVAYLHWEDLYKKSWFKEYNSLNLQMNNNSVSEDSLYNKVVEFFQSTVYLFQIYLRNQGIFYNDDIMIIKLAFRSCFLEDGDSFIVLNDIISNRKKYSKEFVIQSFRENFSAFDNLNNKMVRLVNNE